MTKASSSMLAQIIFTADSVSRLGEDALQAWDAVASVLGEGKGVTLWRYRGGPCWVPHFMYQMDHAYDRHRYWLTTGKLSKMPSEYFTENVYTTFQDDWIAFKSAGMLNPRRLMWANDFPHSDSTWPHSQELLREHAQSLTEDQKD